MANNSNDDKPTIERGAYGDRGVLERCRPDGVGVPSDDQPVLPGRQPVPTPGDVKRK
jgi:hypothetical protein